MRTEYIELTSEKFKEIYTSEKFRNEVAFAHGVQLSNKETFRGTCSYPVRYRVTEEQINEAKKLREAAKKETYAKHENDLLFVSMGMDYKARYEDDVCNHRIRTEFVNADGHRFFIEVGTGRGDEMRVDFAVDRDMQIDYSRNLDESLNKRNSYQYMTKGWQIWQKQCEKWRGQPYYNYNGLERSTEVLKYTKKNILDLVNKVFNCKFKNIVIDSHNISCGDREVICFSPKK